MSPRSLVVISLLFVAALCSWYLASVNSQRDDEQRAIDPVHRGFYLKNARILGTGPDGDLL